MTVKKITQLALLTAIALIIFIVELRIPNLVPIPGVKLGLANIVTVYAMYHCTAKETMMIVIARILLGSIFGGNISAIFYSLGGALLCLAGMLLLRRVVDEKYIWICSILGAVLHNIGQITVAVVMMKSRQQEAENQMQRIRNEITMLIGDIEIGANCGTKAFKDYLYQTLKLPVMKVTASNKEAADDASMIMLKEWCDVNRPELSPLFTLVQEYRKWGKIKSTYIDGYMKYINSATGRIHPDFFALSTETGRIVCAVF